MSTDAFTGSVRARGEAGSDPDSERYRQELERLGVPYAKTVGMRRNELIQLLNDIVEQHNAKVRAGKSDAATRHSRFDEHPSTAPHFERTTAMTRAQLLDQLSPEDRQRCAYRSDEYIRGIVAEREDGDEIAELCRRFDEALEFPELYAAAEPWKNGEVAARNAALAAMKARR